MKKEFDFSRPCPCVVVFQALSTDGEHWQKESVAFVIDTNDARLIEDALTKEADSHKDWTLTETRQNERILSFTGGGRFKKLFIEETTQYLTK